MNIANEKAQRDLEFDRLKSIVQSYCSSSLGVEAIDTLIPTADREAIETSIAEVSEAILYLEKADRFSLGGVRDLAPLLQQGKERVVLDGKDFVTVLLTLNATQEIRGWLLGAENLERLGAYAERLTGGSSGLATAIERVIDERGALRPDATPELKRLHHAHQTAEARLESKLRAFLDRNADLISEPVITRRRGRMVVPIRSGATGASDFVVHDRSATGQTLYAEPTALVRENNAVSELAEAVRSEERRILRELTAKFVAAESALLRDRVILAHLDSLFARAAYAGAYHCAFPRFGEKLALRHGRHPLLPPDRAVPVSLTLGDGSRMTIITGPNTGGKTVTLKTLGLLTLMVQAAIPIPASPDSEWVIISRVRTDIGDEQSIEQSLSTFSAHMKNLVSVLGEAGDDALILLDELGAGTDPQEGAALGLSMIEALLETNALVAISTHLTPVKYFAVRHPGIRTASMEFDLATLSPTFRVIEGVPGRSNAFVIAQRLGLPEDLVERARGFLSQGEIRAEDIIEELHRERQALARQHDAARREHAEAKRLKEAYEAKAAAFEHDRESALSERLRAFDAFLHDGQRRVEEILSQTKDGSTRDQSLDALRELVDLREETKVQRKAAEPVAPERLDPSRIQEGQLVHVSSLAGNGRIVHLDGKGNVTVDLDGIRVTTGIEDVTPPRGTTKRAAARKEKERERSRVKRPRPSQVPLQLDVRGLTVSEALREVDAYLDQLLLADIRSATILHGKGTGALRDAIHAYLGSVTAVASYGFAPPNRGGEGVTAIELSGRKSVD